MDFNVYCSLLAKWFPREFLVLSDLSAIFESCGCEGPNQLFVLFLLLLSSSTLFRVGSVYLFVCLSTVHCLRLLQNSLPEQSFHINQRGILGQSDMCT